MGANYARFVTKFVLFCNERYFLLSLSDNTCAGVSPLQDMSMNTTILNIAYL